MKEIYIKENFILLGQFLKFAGVICNGGEAKNFLANNKVLVNNMSENRRGRKLFVNDVITISKTSYIIKGTVIDS